MITIEKLRQQLPELNFEEGVAFCGGEEDFYIEVFQDFTEMKIETELKQCYENGDYKNYHIRVHGFKNGAYSVGAREIGDLAYELEKMTIEKFPEDLLEKQNYMFEKYKDICQRYLVAVGK